MSRILLLYASMTGNTEQMARIIHEELQKKGVTATEKSLDFDTIAVHELVEYDGILFGTYTYNDGDLPYEVEDFYEDMARANLKGKIVAVFGSGDTFYEHFGQAVDTMADYFAELGATVVGERVKADLDPDEEDEKRCRQLAADFLEALAKQNQTAS